MTFPISESNKEYIDEAKHPGMGTYYDVLDLYQSGRCSSEKTRLSLRKIIEEDPDFLDPYLLLADLVAELPEGENEAIFLIQMAFTRALSLLEDEKQEYPQRVEWGWMENRHILRAIWKWADSLWMNDEIEEAAELCRFLLAICPGDNLGARYTLLAILEGINYQFFQGRYQALVTGGWFDEGAAKYQNEFTAFYEELRRFEEG